MSWQNFFATKLYSDVSDVATTITLETAPTVTAGRLVLEARNTGQREIIKYTGVVGNQITGVSRGQEGTTARSHLAGTVVEMNLTAQDIIDAMNVPNDIITKIDETTFDFVAEGCILAGVSYGASLNYTMTLGTVYINGTRVVVSAIASTALAASKDNYIDVGINGVVTVTAVANNAASPALAANSIRLGIIVTGAANIANVGSVNQGQENKVLPIASSIAYSVTDSLGNLICPRDPQRKVLGYRQATSSSNPNTTPTAIPGLTVPVIVPTGRKVKVSFYGGAATGGAPGAVLTIALYETSILAGNRLNSYDWSTPNTNYVNGGASIAQVATPNANSKTYLAAYSVNTGAGTLTASATAPAYILVELV